MLSQRPVLRQEQRLKLTPQLYQAIRIMAMPMQELRTSIQEELERNPALEEVEDQTVTSLDSLAEEGSRDHDSDETGSAITSDSRYSGAKAAAGDEEANRRFLEGALSRPETLQEHLLWQLRLQPITEVEFALGETLIRNLDQRGFHREDPAILDAAAPAGRLRRMIALIQGLDPVGTCAADVTESLLAQIRVHPSAPPGSATLVAEHFELAERGKLAEVARLMKLETTEIEDLLEFIASLEPIPGRNFSNEPARYVVPDVIVRMVDGQLRLIFNDHQLPVLGVTDYFEELSDTSRDRDLKRFINQNVQDARWFIRSIDQRNKSLMKVAKAIVEFQRAFFRGGPKQLVPLTLKDVAADVGVHEATVSRLANGKYMQTEFGIFELRFFFTNSITGAGSKGSRFSKVGVREMVREIIQKDGGGGRDARPLSDNRIAALLQEQGVSIARRTVAKYRKELDIDSSFSRRPTVPARHQE
jgi:RNA polymerase sigma-54 factor